MVCAGVSKGNAKPHGLITQILFDVTCTEVPFLIFQMPLPSEVSSLEEEVAQLKQEVKKLEMEREGLSTELKEYQNIKKEFIVSGLCL